MVRRLALLSTLFASLVDAANPKATSLAKEAERLSKDGQYLPAARALEEALALELNRGEFTAALDASRGSVTLPSNQTEPDLTKKANLAMDRLRQIIARQQADARANEAEKDRLEKARAERAHADVEARKARQQKASLEEKEMRQQQAQQTSSNSRRLVAFATLLEPPFQGAFGALTVTF